MLRPTGTIPSDAAPGRALLGSDPNFVKILDRLPDLARSDASVVIFGASGTGKEALARRIHELSGRAGGPLIALNCGAIPPSLLDSELFGHEKGAFTGALSRRVGKLEQASGGTLFLDEISEMPAEMQVRLLRFLQEGEVQRVGGNETIKLDARIVCATNVSLELLAAGKKFREDLYFRLSVITITVPPLRARGDDIELLAVHYLRSYAKAEGKTVTGFTDEAKRFLVRYSFPGNVRELCNIVHRAVVLCQGERIGADDLPGRLHRTVDPGTRRITIQAPMTGKELAEAKAQARKRVTEQVEVAFVKRLLAASQGNVSEAARTAEINRSQLHQMIRRCKLDPADFRGRP